MSDDLKQLFDTSRVPAPRAELAERILAAAPARASNDNRRWVATTLASLGAVAAALIAGLFVFAAEPQDDSEAWAQYAEAAGFAELHAWVEGVE